MKKPRGLCLKDLNPLLTCPLCSGYLIDATKLLDCMHTFCRSCIVKHFENSKCCPVKHCLQPYKDKKPDMTLQTLVYKIVPGLYSKEIQRRDDFYRSTDARASSSCSDDSLFGENNHEQEEWIHNLGQENPFLSPDDSISLSLEYYQRELDTTPIENGTKTNVCGSSDVKTTKNVKNTGVKCDRRYLQCPAAVQMTHLQKFIRMKFGLKDDHKVDIIHNGEVLPTFFTLMDVAYTFKWNRIKPLRFFYRIFSHVKIKPIRIINTTSSAGEKHHQIVSISGSNSKDDNSKDFVKETKSNKEETIKDSRLVLNSLEEEQRNKDKERLMNELKLQVRKKTNVEDVDLFRYGEDNNKEKFAENRDREWELLKNPDEEYKISKKRKKNKHSKDEHKKRKLHAEITSEESLKLKVKITPHNGHKHKHHKNVGFDSGFDQDVVSSKEKVNQLRQIRHKNCTNSEEKGQKPSESKDFKDNKESGKDLSCNFVQNNKNIQYPPGFTVSRVDSGGVKRKIDDEIAEKELKKPSLEITLIRNPTVSQNNQKRPPPATIPLQKIKNSFNFSSGVSIIPKIPEKSLKNEGRNDIPVKNEVRNVKNEVKNVKNEVRNVKNEVRNVKNERSEIRNVKNEKSEVRNVKNEVGNVKSEVRNEIDLKNVKGDVRNVKREVGNVKNEVGNVKNEVGNVKSEVRIEKSDKYDKNDKNETVPLDLSKPNNGLSSSGNQQMSNLSNLQMLSKVASEHAQNMNKMNNKQIPNLQSIRLPFHHHHQHNHNQNVEKITKSMPKLNEINKNDFLQNRILNNSRINRPNQNQCIRNIPNPSLLVRQQNQNRLNCLMQQNNQVGEKSEVKNNQTNQSEKNEVKITQKVDLNQKSFVQKSQQQQHNLQNNQSSQNQLCSSNVLQKNQLQNQQMASSNQRTQCNQQSQQKNNQQNAQNDVQVKTNLKMGSGSCQSQMVAVGAANGKKEIPQTQQNQQNSTNSSLNLNEKEKKDKKEIKKEMKNINKPDEKIIDGGGGNVGSAGNTNEIGTIDNKKDSS